jgi:hypothetical protein
MRLSGTGRNFRQHGPNSVIYKGIYQLPKLEKSVIVPKKENDMTVNPLNVPV